MPTASVAPMRTLRLLLLLDERARERHSCPSVCCLKLAVVMTQSTVSVVMPALFLESACFVLKPMHRLAGGRS